MDVDVVAPGERDVVSWPAYLAWTERGSSLIRRMNSERVAEDPRLKRLLFASEYVKSTAHAIDAIQESANEADDEEEEKPMAPLDLADVKASKSMTQRDSFEQLEAETSSSDGESKHESDNVASNAYKVVLWTYRLQASLQSSLQYAMFAKASDDGYLIPVAPRVFCIAPFYVNVLNRLFGVHCTSRNWTAAVKLLEQLDSLLSKKFADGACIFDCGLFDGVKRLHHKPLVYDEFCDGRIASISSCRGSIPSMHSAFVISSTVAAWLDLNASNVAVLVAPNNEQMSVFATCCTLYCTEAMSFPENFGNELLDAYQQHIRGSESWPAKLQRTLSGLDPKNIVYSNGVPRPQARFISDFCKLLELRDKKLLECADLPELEEKKQKLTGVTVTPAPQSIYIHEIVLQSDSGSSSSNNGSSTEATAPYRPYFVIQSEKGVLFSSMVNGVRDADVWNGPHAFRVAKTFDGCGDFVLKMYHLPFGRQGELIFDARLHASVLLDVAQLTSAEENGSVHESLDNDAIGDITLKLENGDFDCISANHPLPKKFTVRLRYSRKPSAFPADVSSLNIGGLTGVRHDHDVPLVSDAATASPAEAGRSFNGATTAASRAVHAKPVRYDGPAVVSFLLSQSDVRTAFGDVILDKIDVIRRLSHGQLDIYLLFHVNLGFGELKVLPYRHMFRYVLPDPIRERMIEMGASEESLNANAPSSFDSGIGMSFDEEYARWLQHVYDTDLNTSDATYDGEFLLGVPITDVVLSPDFRCVSISIQVAHEPTPMSFRPGGYLPQSRGATSTLIHQLPTYIYSAPKDHDSQANPDCLVCRCSFEVGEEIKSLPCFHSYHSDCINSWLCLNKVCPVCQFSIDHLGSAQ